MGTLDEILLARENEIKKLCIGKEITEARENLGYWWVLTSQNVTPEKSVYIFNRAGYGRLAISAKNNIVTSANYAIF